MPRQCPNRPRTWVKAVTVRVGGRKGEAWGRGLGELGLGLGIGGWAGRGHLPSTGMPMGSFLEMLIFGGLIRHSVPPSKK